MFAQCSRPAAARLVGGVRTRAGVVVRRQQRAWSVPNARRPNSTSTGSGSGSSESASPLVAGIVGGGVALVGGYAWYHLSGTSKVISNARAVIDKFEQVQKTLSEKTPNPSQAISFIRTTTQQYASLVPGVKQYIDPVFEELDSLSESHGQEVNEILSRTYNELKETISNGGLDKQTGEKVADIIKRRAVQLKDLAKDASSKVLDDNPQLKEKVGGSLDELKKYAKSYGPEAQKVVDETYQQIQDIVSEGMSPSAVSKAMSLVQQKRQQIMDMGSKAAEKAWEQGSQQAQSYLDRSPELKKLFDEKKDDLKRLALGGGISTASIPQIFSKVRDVASSGDSSDSVDKLRQYLDSTTKQGQSSLSSLGSNLGSLQDSSSWEGTLRVVQNYLKSIPGGEEMLKQSPSVDELMEMAKTKGPEAKRIADETLKEISEVLERKMKEAKEIARDR